MTDLAEIDPAQDTIAAVSHDLRLNRALFDNLKHDHERCVAAMFEQIVSRAFVLHGEGLVNQLA